MDLQNRRGKSSTVSGKLLQMRVRRPGRGLLSASLRGDEFKKPRSLGEGTGAKASDNSEAPQTATASRVRLYHPELKFSVHTTFRPGWPKASSLSLTTRSPRSNSHSERQPNIVFGHRRSGGFGANEVTQLGKLDSRAKCVGSWEPMKY